MELRYKAKAMWKCHIWQSPTIAGGGDALVNNSVGNIGYGNGEWGKNRFLTHMVDKNQFQVNSRPKYQMQSLKPAEGNIAEKLYDLKKRVLKEA